MRNIQTTQRKESHTLYTARFHAKRDLHNIVQDKPQTSMPAVSYSSTMNPTCASSKLYEESLGLELAISSA